MAEVREIEGLKLYHCPVFDVWIRPGVCKENREMVKPRAKRKGSRPRPLRSIGGRPVDLDGVVHSARKSRQVCVKCPGVVLRSAARG